MDHSPSGSSVCGIFQARILEWIAISFPKALSEVTKTQFTFGSVKAVLIIPMFVHTYLIRFLLHRLHVIKQCYTYTHYHI